MPLSISTHAPTGSTLKATLERISDSARWRNASPESWEPAGTSTFANRAITLAEGSGEDTGSYTAGNDGDLGDAGLVRVRIHDSGAGEAVIGMYQVEVAANAELPVALILNRIGLFTGSGQNTILGALQALMRSDVAAPSDIGGTFDSASSSLQAISTATAAASGTASSGNYLADLIATRNNIAAQLADMTVNPKPSYTIDGQSVDWDSHFRTLSKQLEELNQALQAGEPFEIHTSGYTS